MAAIPPHSKLWGFLAALDNLPCTNPDEIKNPVLRERATYFKKDPEGRKILEEAYKEQLEQQAKDQKN
ncbi:hypothetical protein [Allobaculum sp. JKK-2023]|uniref:hypothetical protein n=1 Tax=Allobaculum sp. JKK-2023 TaxID=3108943 RepID=UPI002B0589F1|nr:hypothetical protein [Allobaculum sp. JKK-2023]